MSLKHYAAILLAMSLLVIMTISIAFSISIHILQNQIIVNRAHGILLQNILCQIVHHYKIIAKGC